MKIWREYTFEAAHQLPNVPVGHKCGRMHGHSYRVEIHVVGKPDEHTGMIMDFADLDLAWRPIHSLLDHQTLNEILTLYNPTSEHLARWIWDQLEERGLAGLDRIVISETPRSGCEYTGS